MKCPRCGLEVTWPASVSADERRAIVEFALSSHAPVGVEIARRHWVGLKEAKTIAMHLPRSVDACSRPGCSQKRIPGQAICTKCGALSLTA